MTQSTLTLNTANGSRYLQQLGKHFGHKVPAVFNTTEGRVSLPFGQVELAASDAALSITVQGDARNLDRLETFVGDHLARFAFRENPKLTWQRNAQSN